MIARVNMILSRTSTGVAIAKGIAILGVIDRGLGRCKQVKISQSRSSWTFDNACQILVSTLGTQNSSLKISTSIDSQLSVRRRLHMSYYHSDGYLRRKLFSLFPILRVISRKRNLKEPT